MHLILTGATGLAGSAVLDAMIKMNGVTKISILSRRPVRMVEDVKDPRINVIIQKDFENYSPEVLAQLKGARGCVWALGISQAQVGKEDYIKITKNMPLAASAAFQSLPDANEPFNFVYVSGWGTTTTPGRFTQLWARVKGEAELGLAEQRKANPLLRTSVMRPAFIDESTQPAIIPYVPQRAWHFKLILPLASAIRFGFQNLHNPSQEWGRFMTEMAMGKYDGRLKEEKDLHMVGEMPIVESSAFRRLVGLD